MTPTAPAPTPTIRYDPPVRRPAGFLTMLLAALALGGCGIVPRVKHDEAMGDLTAVRE